jgi:hypothetical protein
MTLFQYFMSKYKVDIFLSCAEVILEYFFCCRLFDFKIESKTELSARFDHIRNASFCVGFFRLVCSFNPVTGSEAIQT